MKKITLFFLLASSHLAYSERITIFNLSNTDIQLQIYSHKSKKFYPLQTIVQNGTEAIEVDDNDLKYSFSPNKFSFLLAEKSPKGTFRPTVSTVGTLSKDKNVIEIHSKPVIQIDKDSFADQNLKDVPGFNKTGGQFKEAK